MRNIQTVIAQIIAAIPPQPPSALTDNLTALTAELSIINRTASYWPPEVENELWSRLGAVCYRYLPPPTFAPWAAAISVIITQ
jgi:hypothetical protein